MPEILASLAPNLLQGASELGGAAAPELAGGFGSAAASGLGSFGDLAAAGLPFGAGVGELGSVATGVGASGVTPFLDAFAALGGGAAGLGGVGGLAGLGAGVGEIGSNVAGIGADLGGLGSAVLPEAAALTAGTGLGATAPSGTAPTGTGGVDLSTAGLNVPSGPSTPADTGVSSTGGVTSVGPTAGTPAGPISQTSVSPTGTSAASVAAPEGAGALDLTSALKLAGPAVAAAGLGYNILQGQKPPATTQAINTQSTKVQEQAAGLTGQGQQLVSHLESGTLPPNVQMKIDEDTKAAKAKITSNYASQGMNTDPNKNSMLRQELAGVDRQAKVLSGQLAQQLAQSGTGLINAGTQLTGLDNDLLKTLSNLDTTSTARIGSAIANFASALSGNKGGINLKLA